MAQQERVVVKMPANTMMEQTRVRAGSVASITLPPKTLAVLDMSYHRNLSPGSRRLTNPARASDSGLDPYYGTRHTTHVSPRGSSDRVIPISTQTYVNVPASAAGVSSVRPVSGYDTYSGRPRRSSLIDSNRGSSAVNQPVSRSRPIVQNDYVRPPSPARRDREYYVTPASSIAPKETRKFEHKKVYSVDDGGAKLVADVNLPAGGERHHRRRESGGGDTSAYRNLRADNRKSYHGPSSKYEKAIEDDDFSYTDPAAMYKDTEPRWRPETRQRRGSVDRGGASRERPASMLEPFGSDPRRSARDIGPPPSQRGWDKIKDLGRSQTVREPRVAQSPSRGRDEARPGFVDPRDPYAVAPRRTSVDRHRPVAVAPDRSFDAYDTSDAEDRREPRHHARRYSATKPDRSVSRRGFGIRPESKDRFGNRSSDESFEQRQRDLARDSGYAEPHRRDTAPTFVYPEHEHRRAPATDDRDRVPTERDAAPKQSRRREHERSYEDYESDRDRASGRTKPRDRDGEREDRRERHHHRHDTADGDYDRRDKDQRDSGDSVGGAAKVAVGGLGAAAALYGLNKEKGKREDRKKDEERERERDEEKKREREREKERELEWQREREQEQIRLREADRVAEAERTREAERLQELERSREAVRATEPPRKDRDTDSDRRRRRANSHSDDAPADRSRDAYPDPDRGLGFAFEGPGSQNAREQPREAPRETQRHYAEPDSIQQPESKRSQDRDLDGAAYDAPTVAGAQMPGAFVDPDEEYRRRMEQVQRELGLPQAETAHSSDSDPDRERRRRERAQRQAERQTRMGNAPPEADSEYRDVARGDPRDLRRSFDDDASQAPSSVTWNSGTSTAQPRELRRRNSILDRPMEGQGSAGMAQIIDNSQSDRRETRVRIVDPPSEESDNRPKGILKRPTPKFPDHPNQVREGVAPLKDANKKGIPPGARWTKIDRKLVNPEALEDAKERFEERMDFVIVLRVLTKEEIQKLADRTREIREKRHETPEERTERHSAGDRRRKEKDRERRERDEYSDHSEDEYAPKAPRMLEAPASAGAIGTSAFGSEADFVREGRERRGERERDGERERERVHVRGSREEM